MDDFTVDPNQPNAFGLIQSAENAPKPGVVPLSSMTPTIVLKDDKVFLMVGASGGPRIISSVLNVMLRVLDDRATLEDAVLDARPHHQLHPNEVSFDREPDAELADALRKRGHKISDKKKTGIVQAILRDSDGWIGASDPRKGGKPMGR
jgi:gamma-glutamyltranspeptidase/glutathione hydrolase